MHFYCKRSFLQANFFLKQFGWKEIWLTYITLNIGYYLKQLLFLITGLVCNKYQNNITKE